MTEAYDWTPMPHRLDIKCPACGHLARFEFAQERLIELKKDIPFFQNGDFFEYRRFQGWGGQYQHSARYYPGLHGSSALAAEALPEGYQASDWATPKYLYRCTGSDMGSVRCEHCRLRRKHPLRWPDDAYFAIAYKGHVLWAFCRESAYELNQYLSSKFRDRAHYRWRAFLLHIPTVFKTTKAREAVCKQLERLLQVKPDGRAGKAALRAGKLGHPPAPRRPRASTAQ